MKDWLSGFLKFLFRIFYRLIFRVEVIGRGNIPKKGAYILASNHLSNLDPPLVGCFSGRADLFYMAKEEMFKNKIWGAIFKYLKMIPIRRGSNDKDALFYALKILSEGHSLLIFPEGTRRKNGKINPRKGVGFLAVQSGKQVIPIKVINTEKFSKLKKIKMIIGKPILIDVKKEYLEISREILDIIEAMDEA